MSGEEATYAKVLPRILPLPFRRGEGRGEGSVRLLGFRLPSHAQFGLQNRDIGAPWIGQ